MRICQVQEFRKVLRRLVCFVENKSTPISFNQG